MGEEGFIWEEMPGSVEGSLKSFYNKGIEDNTGEVFLSKEEEEIEVVTTGGFFGNEDRVFGKGGKFFEEGFKVGDIHGEGFFKDDLMRRGYSTGRKGSFGDIDADKDFKVVHESTSYLDEVAEQGICQPILLVYKGFCAQTNLSWFRQRGNKLLRGLKSPGEKKLSCSAPNFKLLPLYMW